MKPYISGNDNVCRFADPRNIAVRDFIVYTESDTPVYLQLANQLQQLIEQQQYDPEQPLPSLNTFNHSLGISRATAFRAYIELSRNGLVKWIKGQGFFVRKRGAFIKREIDGAVSL